jgi:hypothetical protein
MSPGRREDAEPDDLDADRAGQVRADATISDPASEDL